MMETQRYGHVIACPSHEETVNNPLFKTATTVSFIPSSMFTRKFCSRQSCSSDESPGNPVALMMPYCPRLFIVLYQNRADHEASFINRATMLLTTGLETASGLS